MLEKILKLSEEKKAALGGIYDIRDESDRTGMRAVVELRKRKPTRTKCSPTCSSTAICR